MRMAAHEGVAAGRRTPAICPAVGSGPVRGCADAARTIGRRAPASAVAVAVPSRSAAAPCWHDRGPQAAASTRRELDLPATPEEGSLSPEYQNLSDYLSTKPGQLHEFSELFAAAVRGWRGVPRYAHLLLDQTQVEPDELRGELRGRIAQLALMAAYRASWPVMQRLVPLLAELVQAGGIDELEPVVVYLAATTKEPERWNRFADAVRREVPGGGDLMNKTTQEMLEIYGEMKKQEAEQKAQQKVLTTQVRIIEGFLGQDVPWSTIEAATGIDEVAFGRLKQQLEAATSGTSQ